MKSNEYDIRFAVVKKLLEEGVPREDIRLEIPLDTASSNGRADIVILGTNWLGCIELKSGKDKFDPEAIKEQCAPYRRTFDKVGVIVDLIHKKEWLTDCSSTRDNWGCVNLGYCHETKSLQNRWNGRFGTKPVKDEVWDWWEGKTCAYDMANILWASEIKDIVKNYKATKCTTVRLWAEEKCLKDVRKLVMAALQKRPLNKWEEKFWRKFDAQISDELLCAINS